MVQSGKLIGDRNYLSKHEYNNLNQFAKIVPCRNEKKKKKKQVAQPIHLIERSPADTCFVN